MSAATALDPFEFFFDFRLAFSRNSFTVSAALRPPNSDETICLFGNCFGLKVREYLCVMTELVSFGLL